MAEGWGWGALGPTQPCCPAKGTQAKGSASALHPPSQIEASPQCRACPGSSGWHKSPAWVGGGLSCKKQAAGQLWRWRVVGLCSLGRRWGWEGQGIS